MRNGAYVLMGDLDPESDASIRSLFQGGMLELSNRLQVILAMGYSPAEYTYEDSYEVTACPQVVIAHNPLSTLRGGLSFSDDNPYLLNMAAFLPLSMSVAGWPDKIGNYPVVVYLSSNVDSVSRKLRRYLNSVTSMIDASELPIKVTNLRWEQHAVFGDPNGWPD